MNKILVAAVILPLGLLAYVQTAIEETKGVDRKMKTTTRITPEQEPIANIESLKQELRDTPVDTQPELVVDQKQPGYAALKNTK